MSKTKWPLLLALAVVASLLVSGCFGGGPSAPEQPRTVVEGEVLVPDETLAADALARGISGYSPLADATVRALEVPSLNPIGNAVQTDSSGRYSLTGLPEGITVIIVATKDLGTTTVRASTLVPEVTGLSNGNVDDATSLAAEVIASRVRQDPTLAEGLVASWGTARESSRDYISSQGQPLDLTVGGEVLAESLGDGLTVPNAPEIVNALLPEFIDSDVTAAKRMVQSLRDAGYGLENTTETQFAKHQESLATEVGPFVGYFGMALSMTLDKYNQMAALGQTELTEAPYHYQMTPSENGLEFTVTSQEDPNLLYQISVTSDTPLFGEVLPAQIDLVGTFSNTELNQLGAGTTTLAGSASLTYVNNEIDTLSLDGSLSSSILSVDGNLDFQFISTGTTAMESFAASCSATFPTFTIEGSFTLVLFPIEVSGESDMIPKSFHVHGEFSDHESTPTVLSGDVDFTWDNIEDFAFDAPLSETNYPEGSLSFSGSIQAPGQATLTASLNFSFTQYGQVTSTLSYARNDRTLDGSAVVNYDSDGITSVALELASNEGLVTNLTYQDSETGFSATGAICKDSKELATVSIGSIHPVVQVAYIDGTNESLF